MKLIGWNISFDGTPSIWKVLSPGQYKFKAQNIFYRGAGDKDQGTTIKRRCGCLRDFSLNLKEETYVRLWYPLRLSYTLNKDGSSIQIENATGYALENIPKIQFVVTNMTEWNTISIGGLSYIKDKDKVVLPVGIDLTNLYKEDEPNTRICYFTSKCDLP